MRFGNYAKVSKDDIQDGFIRAVDLKSKSKRLSIPLNPISKEILEKYEYDLPRISNQKMNKYIKEDYKKTGDTEEDKKTMKQRDEEVEIKSKYDERNRSHTARSILITVM